MRDETLWRKLEAVDLLDANDLIVPRIFLLGGKPMAVHVKLEIIKELKRFFYLLAISDEPLVPSPHVRIALECFLAKNSSSLAPVIGQRRISLTPVRAYSASQQGYRRAIELRAMEFGATDPEHVWPSPFSWKLQMLGWGALAAGLTLAIAARFGLQTQLISLFFLVSGGFLWLAEGPWPWDLPFHKNLVAKLTL